MTVVYPHTQTVTGILVFLFLFLWYLLRRAAHHRIDVYDLAFLSTVGVLPAAFVLLPDLVFTISSALGVAFPFLLLFGALIFVLFLICLSLILRINKLKNEVKKLSQELALRS